GLLINFGGPSLEYKRFVYGPQITQTNEDYRGAVGERQAIYHPCNLRNLWKLSARLELSKAIGGTGKLQFKRPFCLEVTFDENEKEFALEFSELNIFISAYTPEELYKAFCEDITWLWQEYVKCDERELSPDGMRLRRELQNLLDEAPVA
ncbi:MAG: hypothetical protein H8E10_00635, partial [Desulfobacterales bacterium]|nr:hypothetical protein [Desulfobacterales bacterium]